MEDEEEEMVALDLEAHPEPPPPPIFTKANHGAHVTLKVSGINIIRRHFIDFLVLPPCMHSILFFFFFKLLIFFFPLIFSLAFLSFFFDSFLHCLLYIRVCGFVWMRENGMASDFRVSL